MSRSAPLVVYRVFVRKVNRSASSARFKASMTDLPLLGFRLLMVFTPAK
jgi:hypothetical protein